MDTVDTVLASLLAFAAVALGITAGVQLVAPLFGREARETRQARRRMRKEFQPGRAGAAAAAPLFRNPDQLVLDGPAPAGEAPGVDGAAPRRPRTGWAARVDELVDASGLPLTRRQFVYAAGGLGAVVGLVGTVLGGFVLGLGAAAAGAAALPLYARHRIEARREHMLQQLPNAFALMARVIRSGHSVPQAVQAVADAFEGPLAAEFARCQKQQNLGIRPEVTFHEMAQRTGILEVRVFVTAMLIQRQVGGNLSEMLDRLAALIRDRLRVRKQVRTLTAEGRLQGLTLLVLPFVVFAALFVINRRYAMVLLDHPSLLLVTAAVMGVGVLWIRRIVNFEI
jgi:tight adherence protein B